MFQLLGNFSNIANSITSNIFSHTNITANSKLLSISIPCYFKRSTIIINRREIEHMATHLFRLLWQNWQITCNFRIIFTKRHVSNSKKSTASSTSWVLMELNELWVINKAEHSSSLNDKFPSSTGKSDILASDLSNIQTVTAANTIKWHQNEPYLSKKIPNNCS